jgi:hypothetical protein
MNRFKNHLIAAAGLALLAGIGSIMNSLRPSVLQAAGGPTVTIDQSQLPLPIQGSTTVSGTVSATQSGAWNVGITGTPNVNVVNTASVQLAGTPTVNVTNQANAPVFFVNVNDPGRIPYQSEVDRNGSSCTPNGTEGVCRWGFGPVPANHRLVVEHVTASLDFTAAPTFISVYVSSDSLLKLFSTFFAPLNSSGVSVFDQPVRFYVDQSQFFTITVIVQSAQFNNVTQQMTVTGYLIDCLAGPCAAITQ